MNSEFVSPGKKIFITGHELRLQGNFELAIDLFQDILNSPAAQDSILKVDTLNELVICHRALHIYEMAAEYSLEALDIAKSNEYKIGMANALLNLGALAHLSYSLKEAKDFFRQSLSIFETDLQDRLGVAKLLVHLGLVSRDEGMVEKAEGDLYTAYKLIEKDYSDPEYRYVLVRVLIHLGITKLLELNFVEGIKLFKESLTLSENTKDESKKPMILRNLALCNSILDNKNEFFRLISESIEISNLRKQISELFLSKLYLFLNYFSEQNYTAIPTILNELESLTNLKYSNNNFLIYFVVGLLKSETSDKSIIETLSNMENYFRSSNHNIKNDHNLILLEIETIRVLSDQITAEAGGYSFGLSRKFEKLIRVARGHKEERVYLIAYCYLLDLLIPKIRGQVSIKDEYYDPVVKLMKQIKSDISNQLFSQLFSILEVLINIFYTMEFSENIDKLNKVKASITQYKMSELELQIFKLENDLSEKLAKLTEVTELNDLEKIRQTVFSFQQDLRAKISIYLRYFRFKVLQILFLLKDITN